MGGRGPTQEKLGSLGIAYVKKSFPNMDTVISADIVTK